MACGSVCFKVHLNHSLLKVISSMDSLKVPVIALQCCPSTSDAKHGYWWSWHAWWPGVWNPLSALHPWWNQNAPWLCRWYHPGLGPLSMTVDQNHNRACFTSGGLGMSPQWPHHCIWDIGGILWLLGCHLWHADQILYSIPGIRRSWLYASYLCSQWFDSSKMGNDSSLCQLVAGWPSYAQWDT